MQLLISSTNGRRQMINVRNYKQFQVDQFRADITAAPFHVARVFEDKDDVLWAWNKLLKARQDPESIFSLDK